MQNEIQDESGSRVCAGWLGMVCSVGQGICFAAVLLYKP